MADYSLVPVDHQPDFDDVSLVPVDHDPFGGDGVTQQAQTQPAQPPPPATAVGQPNVGAPANNAQASEVGESWNPDTGNSDISGPNPSAGSALPPNNVPFKPFGELKPATFTPTQRIGNLAADAATALGMQPYTANDLARRTGNVLGLTPLGVAGSALDFIDATHRGDLPGAIAAAAGMIPDAKGVVDASAASVLDKLNRYLLNPDHVSGGPKARWFEQALGFTRENAEDLAKQLIFDESQAVQRAVTPHGTKFNQTINVTGANGRTIPVITGWTVGSDGVPRLNTALPRSE